MKNSPSQAVAAELRAYALSFPGATEEFPWGESAFKVKGKVFVFMRASEEGLSMSMKLPQSNATALDKSFAQPTGYGLGKSGWVSCTFEAGERVPVDLIKPWIVESWRAVAPKTLVKQLDAGSSNTTGAPAATTGSRKESTDKASSSKKTVEKKSVAKKVPAKGKTKRSATTASSSKSAPMAKPSSARARKRT
jgi:predicted DNA-binding protein (MmcQ/YjbR family)